MNPVEVATESEDSVGAVEELPGFQRIDSAVQAIRRYTAENRRIPSP